MNKILWMTVPYIALSSFVFGHIWRYQTDQFGWTTRSSQIYESRLLKIASPLFHFGILMVFGGHVMGIGIPQSWTDAVGVSDHAYHLLSLGAGLLSGIAVIVGLAMLVYRRMKYSAVRQATSRSDMVMYPVLFAALLTGMLNTTFNVWANHNYRETVSPWFRSLFYSPQPELMAQAPAVFQIHNLVVLTLLAIWPYTRLVHMFSAPVGYLFRPYVVYRRREPGRGSSHKYAQAWVDPHKTPERSKWTLSSSERR